MQYEQLDETLLMAALDAARKLGADYAEVRGRAGLEDEVRLRNGEISRLQTRRNNGWGLQVRKGAGWGFASSADLTPASVNDVAAKAFEIAAASARVQRAGNLATWGEPSTASGYYESPVEVDPFKVPLDERLEMLFSADAEMRKHDRVRATTVYVQAFRTWKFYANTAGAVQRQLIVESGGGLNARAAHEGYNYGRSFQNYGQGGYEYILDMKLEEQAERVGEEAHILVAAQPVPAGPGPVVIGSNLAALMVHETCGHPTELDRVLGSENAFAGGSFLQPEMRGTFRYGSDVVNLTADATIPGGLGSFGWDDEGTPAQRVPLVEKGIFQSYLSSRDTAAAIGLPAGGMARASSWSRIPIVRMTNVNLEPGAGSFDELIGQVENGLYLETPSSWSLDDKRMNFHFSAELCREIKNGQLGAYYKGASYQSRTPFFWGNCKAVAGAEEWKLYSFLGCAKGEPLQDVHVAHGASPALIENVTVQREG